MRTSRLRLPSLRSVSLILLPVSLMGCESCFGFRDLDVETVEDDNGGGAGGMGGFGGGGFGGGGFGGFGGVGGFGGFGGIGGFGGFGGAGGICLGDALVTEGCLFDDDCASCACEEGVQLCGSKICCAEFCPLCYDCSPKDGLCEPIDGPDPDCVGICVQGSCEAN